MPMKYVTIVLLSLALPLLVQAKTELAADESIPIPKISFDEKGELKITASATSSPSEFDSASEDNNIVGGVANMDIYSSTEFPGQEGKLFQGITLRLFNLKTRLWSLYWVASNTGVLDPPVVGSFENNVGHFFCKDTFKGKPIIVMFRWDARNKDRPVWSQAFSSDDGKTWEWNWYNVSERIP